MYTASYVFHGTEYFSTYTFLALSLHTQNLRIFLFLDPRLRPFSVIRSTADLGEIFKYY